MTNRLRVCAFAATAVLACTPHLLPAQAASRPMSGVVPLARSTAQRTRVLTDPVIVDPAADSLSREHVEWLVLLGRVWGFVKYHDPRVTSGEVNWDAALRRAIPMVLTASDARAARDSIDNWLAALGDPAPCTACATLPADLALRPEIAWIHDERLLGHTLSARLERIYANRSTASDQQYVRLTPLGNPDFAGEATYATELLPPADLRLLAVFRFWNILEYWFPYRDLMEPDRVAILREFIPAAWEATDVARYSFTMMRLVARARDTHANLWSSMRYQPPIGTAQVPVTLRFIDGRFVVTGFTDPAQGSATGLRPGDAVMSIDGVPVDSLTRVVAPYYGASNEAARDRDIARSLLKGSEGPVRLGIVRDGAASTVETTRSAVSSVYAGAGLTHDRPGDTFQMLSAGRDSVAYLKLSSVDAAAIPQYLQRAARAPVFVIDIRNYPKQFVVFSLGAHLVAAVSPFSEFTKGDLANPGAFTMTPPVSLLPFAPHYGGRLVILVDESTQSQAEYTAMAFRSAPGAIVVGSTTAGADGNVSRIPLPGGLQAMISGIGVFYPDGRPTQQIGIVPDVVVHPTIAGIRAGRDEVLEAGVSRALGRDVALQSH